MFRPYVNVNTVVFKQIKMMVTTINVAFNRGLLTNSYTTQTIY